MTLDDISKYVDEVCEKEIDESLYSRFLMLNVEKMSVNIDIDETNPLYTLGIKHIVAFITLYDTLYISYGSYSEFLHGKCKNNLYYGIKYIEVDSSFNLCKEKDSKFLIILSKIDIDSNILNLKAFYIRDIKSHTEILQSKLWDVIIIDEVQLNTLLDMENLYSNSLIIYCDSPNKMYHIANIYRQRLNSKCKKHSFYIDSNKGSNQVTQYMKSLNYKKKFIKQDCIKYIVYYSK